MEQVWGLDLDTLLALAAILLGLSIAAQVLQEIYKYVTASKSRMYRIALRDFLGSWVDNVYKRSGENYEKVKDLFLRGPFQLTKGRKKARLLPMEKKSLLHALNLTAPEWQRTAIDALKKEAAVQQGQAAAPTPILHDLIGTAWKNYQAEDGGAKKTFDFLESWDVAVRPPAAEPVDEKTDDGIEREPPQLKPKLNEQVDAARLLEAFYQKFLPNRTKVEEHFDQFTANFEHAYGRRSLRQTLFLAIVLALGLNLPFSELYRQAKSLSPEEATQLANTLVELHEARSAADDPAPRDEESADETTASDGDEGEAGGDGQNEDEAADGDGDGTKGETENEASGEDTDAISPKDRELEDLIARLKEPLEGFLEPADPDRPLFSRGRDQLVKLWNEDRGKIPGFLANCLITALLISFGAPFWNRLSQALLGVRSATRTKVDNPETS